MISSETREGQPSAHNFDAHIFSKKITQQYDRYLKEKEIGV